jgi:hypothetical protein
MKFDRPFGINWMAETFKFNNFSTVSFLKNTIKYENTRSTIIENPTINFGASDTYIGVINTDRSISFCAPIHAINLTTNTNSYIEFIYYS